MVVSQVFFVVVFFFKQKTAYEMRISDWSSDVCSSDLHLAIGAHIDIDAPALALGGLLIFPCREMLAGRDDHRIGPSGLDTGIPLRRDRGILRGPEGIGIAEIAILAEQVGDDALHPLGVEQRMSDRDRLTAEPP